MLKYFEGADPSTIAQYQKIIAIKDDVKRIASYLEISEIQVRQVKEHIFINFHDIDFPDLNTQTTISFRGNFTPDREIADLWIKANNRNLQYREMTKFRRLIAHEYVEQALMKDGLPYQSREGWRKHPQFEVFAYWPSPEYHGAHDLAPNPSRPQPFSHWEKIIGKSPEGLILADDLSNLDELLEAIRGRI